ncbi:MAG: hypothetical protein WA977_13565 [Halobacteriota archaeon]
MAGFAPKSKFEQTFRCQPLVAHRSPPCRFLGRCDCDSAIDFAEAAVAELEQP